MIKSKQEAMRDVGKVQRYKVEVQKKTVASDAVGNQIGTWNHWRYFWVEANGLFGTEYYAAATVNQENTLELTLRYCKDLDLLDTFEYQVVFKGKTYDIKNIDPVKYENNWVILKLLERGVNGS